MKKLGEILEKGNCLMMISGNTFTRNMIEKSCPSAPPGFVDFVVANASELRQSARVKYGDKYDQRVKSIQTEYMASGKYDPTYLLDFGPGIDSLHEEVGKVVYNFLLKTYEKQLKETSPTPQQKEVLTLLKAEGISNDSELYKKVVALMQRQNVLTVAPSNNITQGE